MSKASGVGGRVQTHPQKFDLVKIQAKSVKIGAKSVKIWEKCVKTLAKSLDVL